MCLGDSISIPGKHDTHYGETAGCNGRYFWNGQKYNLSG